MSSVSELPARVNEIIDRVFSGSLNAAAKAWGIPQATLYRIANGLNRRPSADVLARIARANSTTVDWLLNGEGRGPATQDARTGAPEVAGVQQWRNLLVQLKATAPGPLVSAERLGSAEPTPEEHEAQLHALAIYGALLALVDRPWTMAAQLTQEKTRTSDAEEIKKAALVAMDALSKAWVRFLSEASDVLGPDVVWKRLLQLENTNVSKPKTAPSQKKAAKRRGTR